MNILDIFMIETKNISSVIETTSNINDEDDDIFATEDKNGRLLSLEIGGASFVLAYSRF